MPQAWLLLLFDFARKSKGHDGEETELELLHVLGAHHVKVAVHDGDRREEGLLPERTDHEDLEQQPHGMTPVDVRDRLQFDSASQREVAVIFLLLNAILQIISNLDSFLVLLHFMDTRLQVLGCFSHSFEKHFLVSLAGWLLVARLLSAWTHDHDTETVDKVSAILF